MKIDIVEINRLSPPGLWDLGVLGATITMLRGVIVSGTSGSVLLYGRMVLRYSESLREKTRDNLNMRIRAWVLQCPARVSHVRGIIGEAAIRHWRKNRLADYALTKYFGDWKRKWPEGFSDGGFKNDGFANIDIKSKWQAVPKFTGKSRAYKWKLFALVRIVNVQGLLYRKPKPDQQEGELQAAEMRDAYYKLWGVAPEDDAIRAKWIQPRGSRILKPIRFTPDELALDELETEPEEAAETSPSIVIAQDAPKRIEGEVSSSLKSDDPPSEKKPP